MALHDSRYKRLHLWLEVNWEWMQYFCDLLGLGAVDRQSVKMHRVEYQTRELTRRISDHAWSFRTEAGTKMLLLAEFQSSADAVLVLRQAAYALNHLLAGYDSQMYRLDPVLPQPLLLSLYTGADRWQPRSLAELFGGGSDYKLPFPSYHFDMRHMAAKDIPNRPLLRTVFEIERIEGPQGDAYARALQPWVTDATYTPWQKALLEFGIATLARWTLDNRMGWTSEQLDKEWANITTLEELTVAERMVRTRMDALLAESEARGVVKGRRASLLDLIANAKLTPQDLELCRRGLEQMAPEQMPTMGDLLKVIMASDSVSTKIVQMCQPPQSSETSNSGSAG